MLPGLVLTEFAIICYCSFKGFFTEKIHVYADLLRLSRIIMRERKIIKKTELCPIFSFIVALLTDFCILT